MKNVQKRGLTRVDKVGDYDRDRPTGMPLFVVAPPVAVAAVAADVHGTVAAG
jgi:hypothetical protein